MWIDAEYLERAIGCADLFPPPGDEEVVKIANSHLLALDLIRRVVASGVLCDPGCCGDDCVCDQLRKVAQQSEVKESQE